MKLPRIGITMGDPAGVGPEVIAKALANPAAHALARLTVIGDAKRIAKAATLTGAKVPAFDCVDLGLVPEDLPWGRHPGESAAVAGEASFRYIERAVKMTLAGELDAICTAPISKEAINAAGHKWPGHTEMLADMTGTKEVSLMLFSPRLNVIHVTAHMGLIDAIARIDVPLVERTLARGRELMIRAGRKDPRIGVCGINPHAGEGGLFGRGEEATKILPAVQAAQAKGWKVEGPLPADALMYRAARGDFDFVVAMYHDQGHGPVKALGMEHGVNVTAGLPIVRTSVDHGTAFDIAGTGKADASSMLEAIRLAGQLSQAKIAA